VKETPVAKEREQMYKVLLIAIGALLMVPIAFAGSSRQATPQRGMALTACIELRGPAETRRDVKLRIGGCIRGEQRTNLQGARGLRGVAGPAGPDSPDPNDPETQDAEAQDAEVQDAEIQDPEINDPDPRDPEDPFTPVTAFGGEFEATNASVTMGADCAEFGPYADGGVAGGSVYYSGLNGHPLGDIVDLVYTASYSTDNDTTVGVPYLRVFLEGDTHDVIFSPNTQPVPSTAEDVLHQWDITEGTVRYDDDPGAGPDSTWQTIAAAHADETISGIYVSVGFSAGVNLTGCLRTLGVNESVFLFGS
jgi:hypothetical protein